MSRIPASGYFPQVFNLSQGAVRAVETSELPPKVQMDASGLWAKDAGGGYTFQLDALTGNATFKGSVVAGSFVPASAVTGQLTDAQLAAIAASKVTGQLTDSQLAAIGAAKVTGQLTDAQISAIAAGKVTGQLTDAQIAALAAGKITGQLTDAQIAAIAAAKITGQLTDTQIAALAAAKITGQIVNTQISDNAVQSRNILGLNVLAGHLAAGSVIAGKVAAEAVSANELAVGTIGDNLVVNPSFENPTPGNSWLQTKFNGTGGSFDAHSADDATDGAACLKIISNDAVSGGLSVSSKIIPVNPGETYTIRLKARASAATASGLIIGPIEWNSRPADQTTTPITSFTDLINAPFTVAWTTYQFTYTVPAGIKFVAFRVSNWITGVTAYFDEMEMRKQLRGVNIKDGEIVASKISVAQLSAIAADLGSIVAGTVTGGVIRTAASPAARVEMSGSSIASYDASNVKQMEIVTGHPPPQGWPNLGAADAFTPNPTNWTSFQKSVVVPPGKTLIVIAGGTASNGTTAAHTVNGRLKLGTTTYQISSLTVQAKLATANALGAIICQGVWTNSGGTAVTQTIDFQPWVSESPAPSPLAMVASSGWIIALVF